MSALDDVRVELDALYPGPWALALIPLCGPQPHTHRDRDGVDRECATPGKRPLEPGWQRAAADRYAARVGREEWIDTIARHVAGGRNVGLALPSGAVALDGDDATAVAWLDTALPDTPAQTTARGMHALVSVPLDPRNVVRVPIVDGVTAERQVEREQRAEAPR